MKKMLCLVLALCAALLPLHAFAQEEADWVLEGLVTEITEGGFLMEDIEIGEVQINISDATVWEGIYPGQEMEAGQYVIVDYNGILTRSLPPQAHADRVGCYVLNGVVSEIWESGVLLTGDEIFGDVLVQLQSTLPHVYLNVPLTVYYDGVMALSLPGKVNARHVIVPELTGVVSDRTDESFTLTVSEEEVYQVFLSESTLIGQLSPFAPVEEEADEAEAADEPAAVEWGDGDHVTVYYNGATTRSLPAQLTALEVLVHR